MNKFSHKIIDEDMVYIFFYQKISSGGYFFICPSVQHAINLVSYYAGDCHLLCEVIPYVPVPRSFSDFKKFISGVYGSDFCDLTKQDVLEFEFMYNVSLQLLDLYE